MYRYGHKSDKLKCFLTVLVLFAGQLAYAQKTWFDRSVSIGPSISSIASGLHDPGQLQATFPKKDTATYAINLAVAVNLVKDSLGRYFGRLVGEVHRNTSTDSVQNNWQLGYSYFLRLSPQEKETAHWLFGNIKYVYDGIGITNAFAGEFYYTLRNDQGPFHINANNFLFGSKRCSFILSPYAGFQAEETFKAYSDNAQGFILRPLYTGTAQLSWNHQLPHAEESQEYAHPILSVQLSYTGRWDLINSTRMHEGYTDLLRTELDLYIIDKPVKLSIGPSFNVGSDPLQGLKKQQYWLLSLNISKALSL